jgi:hypothetical protein
MAQTNSNSSGTKICHVISEYALNTLNDELRSRHSKGESLRDLADFVNQQILNAAMSRADASVISDAESLYDVLTSKNVSAGRRAEVETKLRQTGVDIIQLKKDFISHQTVKHHLNRELGVDTSRKSTFDIEDAISRLDWSQSRNEAVIKNTLSQLEALNEIKTCGHTVSSSVRISCDECGKGYHLHEFIDRGGCACQS